MNPRRKQLRAAQLIRQAQKRLSLIAPTPEAVNAAWEKLQQYLANCEKPPRSVAFGMPSVVDAVRFLLKSKPAAKSQAPLAVRRQMALEAHTDPTAKHMAALQFMQKEAGRGRVNWRQ